MREGTYKQIAIDVLKKQGRPMNYIELTKEILRFRKALGKTPDMTVLAMLIRNQDLFVRISRGEYSLKERRVRKKRV